MQTFTPFEYMLIDVANAYGLDKETYDIRISWARQNLNILETFTAQADEPYVYAKTVKNIRDVQAGKPTGAVVRFDAVCSGIQILSVLTRCKSGCEATGAINTGKRPNAYLEVQNTMQQLLGEQVDIDYKSIKESVMTSCYGSRAVPAKHFSGHYLDAFHKACRTVAPGAFNLLNILNQTWNPKAYDHSWYLPDGYKAFVPVLQSEIIEVAIEELGDFPMNTLIVENKPKERSVANIANITHSLDGYVLRSLIRYCNYDKKKAIKVSNLIEMTLLDRSLGNQREPKHCLIKDKVDRLNILDISYINDITIDTVHKYSSDVLRLLGKDITEMLQYEPFEVIPVHQWCTLN